MAFSFAPTYQDYLNYYGKGGDGALSQDQWNALGSSGQWNQLGGGMAIGSDDPRWASIAQQLGITAKTGPDATVMLYGGDKPSDLSGLVDPSRVLSGDGSYATAHDNLTPASEFAGGGLSDRGWILSALGVVGGGALLGDAMGWTGAAEAGGGAAGAAGSSSLIGTPGVEPGAFDIGGSSGFGGSTALSGTPEATGTGAFDVGGSNGFGGSTALSGNNSSLLSQLNSGRQYFNGARSVMSLLSGGQSAGQRSGGMGTDVSSILSSLFGGSGGGVMGNILGLIAGGHQAFGNGIGTASGAQDVANRASQLADPWGSSGNRANFMNMLTPDMFRSLTSQDPSAVLNNPAYQFDLQQGTNAINMGDAAQGTLRSGNRGYELQNYGQGLAAKYGQQMFQNNMSTLQALSGLAGVNAGSPTGSAQALMNGFDNASNIRNAGTNGLFGGGSQNPLFSGTGSSPLMNLLSQVFGGGSTAGLTPDDISNLIGSTHNTGISDDLFNSWMGGSSGDTGISDDLFSSFMGGF